jgi:hypothetical protein
MRMKEGRWGGGGVEEAEGWHVRNPINGRQYQNIQKRLIFFRKKSRRGPSEIRNNHLKTLARTFWILEVLRTSSAR